MKILYVIWGFCLLLTTCNNNSKSIPSVKNDGFNKSEISQLNTSPEPGSGLPSYLYNEQFVISQTKQKEAKFERANRARLNLNNSFWNCDDIVYPKYYGGSFINSAGDFVVFVVGDTVEYKKDLQRRIGNHDFVIYYGQYNLDYLNGLLTKLNIFFSDDKNKEIINKLEIIKFQIVWNRVIVEMNDCNVEKISMFKSLVLDSPALSFNYPKSAVSL